MDRKSTSFPFSKCFFCLLSIIVIFVFILKQLAKIACWLISIYIYREREVNAEDS